MPSLKSIRFQKNDKFGNIVMIASNTKTEELENYEILKNYAEKLEEKQYDTYLPIFQSEEHNYSTIRFAKNPKHNLLTNARYNIEYKIKTVAKNDKIYVNCHIEKLKMVAKPVVEDEREELDLD